jgi:hypothetical protein
MVKFGKAIVANSKPGWEGNYLDYNALKKLLKTSPSDEDFARVLDREVEKVVLFFLSEQGKLAQKLSAAAQEVDSVPQRQRRASAPASPMPQREAGDGGGSSSDGGGTSASALAVGEGIIELLRFLELNVTGLRKILKKHDKLISDQKMAGAFLMSRKESADSHVQQLEHHEGIGAILKSLKKLFQECQARDPSTSRAHQHTLVRVELARQRLLQGANWMGFLGMQAMIFNDDPSLSSDGTMFSSGERALEEAFSPRAFSPRAWEDKLRSTADVPFLTPNLVLNLLSTCLFVTNYYITVPSSYQYLEQIGLNRAYVGLLLSATPLASFASTNLYSSWSEHSIKQPLVASSVLLLCSNVLYASAASFAHAHHPTDMSGKGGDPVACVSAMAMLFGGRLLLGLSAAKAVNRRFIIERVSKKHQNSASVAFMASSAVGMVAAPTLAAIISSATDDRADRYGVDHLTGGPGGVILSRFTMPAWLMALFWSVYILAVLLRFEEPAPREGFVSMLTQACCCRSKKAKRGAAAALLPESEGSDYSSIQHTDEGSPTAANGASELGSWQQWGSRWPWWLSHPELFVTLGTCLFVKMVQEVVIVSAAVITKHYWGWDSVRVGVYLAALGLLMMPLNLFAGRLSKSHDDRDLVAGFETIVGVGLGVTLVHNAGYSVGQYIVGATFVFVGASLLDGVTMSLLSKVVSRLLSKKAKAAGHKKNLPNRFAAGLLGSEAANLGRALGNFLLFTTTTSLNDTVDAIFIPIGGVLLFAFIALCWNRHLLSAVA